MIRWLTSVAAGLCILSLGCFLFTKNPITPTVPDGGFADASPGAALADCSEQALHDAWVKLLPTAETAMATGNLEAALLTEASIVGMPLAVAEFVCAVQWVIDEATARNADLRKFGAADDPVEARKVTNGKAWLARQSVRPTNVAP